MTQRELNAAVARATGEDVREIRHLGFGLEAVLEEEQDLVPPYAPPRRVDWDEVDRARRVAVIGRASHAA